MSASANSARNRFAASPLDRSAQWREAAERGEYAGAPALVFYLSQRGEVLVDTGERLLNHGALATTVDSHSPKQLFLGLHEGAPVAVLLVDEARRESLAGADAQWLDLRLAAMRLNAVEAGFAAYARALLHWHLRHRYCGVCGASTRVELGGHRRRCTRPECQSEHFPRLDPAIIVLVEHQGRCLLGRQAAWPPKRYSVLAGFVEPGETLEDALRREVREESGVEVVECDYHSSQPWPFPSSLMLGFTARAAGAELRYGDELEHAAWFSPEELEHAVASDTLRLPPPVSLSARLIEDWFEARTGRSAAALFGQR
ncbi:MAG: NAD(+) diphosphatase [Lysobacterales bacterium]